MLGTSASAGEEFNTYGAKTTRTTQLVLSSGVPAVFRMDVRVPVGKADLGIITTLDWAHHNASRGFGGGLGINTRVPLYRKDAWSLALRLGIKGDLHWSDGAIIHMTLGEPTFLATVDVGDKFDINMGFELHPRLAVLPDLDAIAVSVALPVRVGWELELSKAAHLGLDIAGGPEITPRAYDRRDPYGRGASYAPTSFGNLIPYVDIRFFVAFAL